MFKNYLTIALRNFWRHKVFSIINISSLSIGISAALVIFMIVSYEFSFDKFEKDNDKVFRITATMHFPDQLFKNPGVPAPLFKVIRNDITGVRTAAPIILFRSDVSINENRGRPVVYKQQADIILTDENYFSIIPHKWLAGSAETLQQPFHVVLTESRARKYFSGKDITKAIGKTVVYNDSIKMTVGGIVQDPDKSTDFVSKEFLSIALADNGPFKDFLDWDKWGSLSSNSQLLIKITDKADPQKLEKQLDALQIKNSNDGSFEINYYLQPLSDIHFNSEIGNNNQRQAHKPTLYGLLVLASFLLLLGCINFINLTTAQASQRAKEIGIRKTMGSRRHQLIFQFLGETFLLTFFATLLAVLLVSPILTIFSAYIPAGITFSLIKQPQVIIFGILLILGVTLFSGFYPALFLSGFKPVLILKNQAFINSGRTRRAWLRQILSVSQFAIAQFFIIATIIAVKQIHFSLNKDLGFRKNAIINFYASAGDDRKFVLKQKLSSIPGIEMISLAGEPPASANTSMQSIKFNTGEKEIETTVEPKYADTNYFKIYGLKLLAGRYLRIMDTSHSITDFTVKEYMINISCARFLGFTNPADALGKYIERGNNRVPIVGVLADFHSKSMHETIKPVVFASVRNNHDVFHIALRSPEGSTKTWPGTITRIEKEFKSVYPEQEAFKYEFFDESIAKFYETDKQISNLLGWSTGLAIVISCLGLFGLVIYTTGVRTKEIGVRKVLGASVSQIVTLLSKDFVRLVILAFIIAAPLAGVAMYKWLEDFAYRTTISWWIFLLSGGLMIIIALLTLSIQTIRSAMANPVNSLRTE